MAYDKVIDSAVLDADLSSVANAIRSKGGTSASLAFPDGFVDAISAIKTGGNMEKYEITFASQQSGAIEITLLTNNAFVKENYAKTGFFALIRPKDSTTKLGYGLATVYHGNTLTVDGVSNSSGFTITLNSAGTAIAFAGISGKINGSTWNFGFRATSAGKLTIYIPGTRYISPGTYEIYLVCEE